MMPASVGVNWPVRMPPMMMTGIISGTRGLFGRSRKFAERRTLAFDADRTEKVAVDHQPDAHMNARHNATRNSPPIETLPVAP